MEIDSATLELLERRLGENVEKRVRSRLFAVYGAAATAFLSAFGYFGYDAVRDARVAMNQTVSAMVQTVTDARLAMNQTVSEMDQTVTDAQQALGQAVNEFKQKAADLAREAVAPSVEGARDAAKQAEDVASSVSIRLSVLSELASDRAARLSVMEEEVSLTVAGMKLQLATLRSDIEDANTQFDEQRNNSNSLYAGAGDLQAAEDKFGRDLGLIAQQVVLLEKQLEELRKGNTEAPLPDIAESSLTFQLFADAYTLQANVTGPEIEKPTVYFQFAGVQREVVRGLSDQLADLGYTMPGAERLGSAARLKEVRYFYEIDKERALGLVRDLNQILLENGYEAELTAEPITGFKGAKPRLGTVELWLEPVPAWAKVVPRG